MLERKQSQQKPPVAKSDNKRSGLFSQVHDARRYSRLSPSRIRYYFQKIFPDHLPPLWRVWPEKLSFVFLSDLLLLFLSIYSPHSMLSIFSFLFTFFSFTNVYMPGIVVGNVEHISEKFNKFFLSWGSQFPAIWPFFWVT